VHLLKISNIDIGYQTIDCLYFSKINITDVRNKK